MAWGREGAKEMCRRHRGRRPGSGGEKAMMDSIFFVGRRLFRSWGNLEEIRPLVIPTYIRITTLGRSNSATAEFRVKL